MKNFNDSNQNEFISSIDETASIWKNCFGFYWYDKHFPIKSDKYFKTEIATLNDFEAEIGPLIIK